MAPSIQSICQLLTIEKYASKKVLLAGNYTMNKRITSIMQPHSLFEAIQYKNWVSLAASLNPPPLLQPPQSLLAIFVVPPTTLIQSNTFIYKPLNL